MGAEFGTGRRFTRIDADEIKMRMVSSFVKSVSVFIRVNLRLKLRTHPLPRGGTDLMTLQSEFKTLSADGGISRIRTNR